MVGKDKIERELVIDSAPQFEKEGELALHLVCGNARIYSAAFSFRRRGESADASGVILLDVGCLQGPPGDCAAEIVRDATRAFHGLRPRDFMIWGLRSVAQAAACEAIVGVSNKRHIYRHWNSKKTLGYDYDAGWSEQCAVRRADGDFELSVNGQWRALSEVPSRKRSETSRKRALVEDLQAQIARSLCMPRMPARLTPLPENCASGPLEASTPSPLAVPA